MQISRSGYTNLIVRREENMRIKNNSIENSVSKGTEFREYQNDKKLRDQYWKEQDEISAKYQRLYDDEVAHQKFLRRLNEKDNFKYTEQKKSFALKEYAKAQEKSLEEKDKMRVEKKTKSERIENEVRVLQRRDFVKKDSRIHEQNMQYVVEQYAKYYLTPKEIHSFYSSYLL